MKLTNIFEDQSSVAEEVLTSPVPKFEVAAIGPCKQNILRTVSWTFYDTFLFYFLENVTTLF